MPSDYGLTVSEFVQKHGVLPRYEFVSKYLWCPACHDTPIATRLEHGSVQIQITKHGKDERYFAEIRRTDGKLICPLCRTELTGEEKPE